MNLIILSVSYAILCYKSGVSHGIGFFVKPPKPSKIYSPVYRSFENMVVSIVLPDFILLLAHVYRT